MPVVGKTLLGNSVTYSPWFSRPAGATSAVCSVYIIGADAGATVTVNVFTRNSEDTNTGGASLGTIASGAQARARRSQPRRLVN